MPRYYCDYCDTYLTHDSPSVRKQHNAGYKHKANVRSYYQQFEEQQTQSLIDQRIKEHLGQAAAFQVGAPFNQHMMQFPGNMPRPRLPILPTPMMPQGYMQQPGVPFAGVRPPILPAPPGPPGPQGYPGGPPMPQMQQQGGPPGSMPMQMAPLPRPPTLPPPTSGAPGAPMSNSAAPPGPPPMYQPNQPPSAGPASGPPAPAAPPQATFSYAQPSEGNH